LEFHKFYVRKNGQGVAYLLFCWTGIPGLIALVEFFIFAFTDSEYLRKKYPETAGVGLIIGLVAGGIIFIGMLAVIAIPNFIVYRTRAYDSSANADIKNAYMSAQAYFTDYPEATVTNRELSETGYRPSEGVVLIIEDGNLRTLKMGSYHERGKKVFFADWQGRIEFAELNSATSGFDWDRIVNSDVFRQMSRLMGGVIAVGLMALLIGVLGKPIGWIWPNIVDTVSAREASKQGLWASAWCAGATILAVILSEFGIQLLNIDMYALFDAFLFIIIGWGIQKMNKVAAVAGLTLYMLERIVIWSEYGAKNLAIAIFISLMFINSIRGNFAYHEFMKDNKSIKEDIEDPNAYSYCPQCKSTYRDGSNICSDCGIELIRLEKE
jgi:hypothetical protein